MLLLVMCVAYPVLGFVYIEGREERKLVIDDGFHRLPLFKAEDMPNPEDIVLPVSLT